MEINDLIGLKKPLSKLIEVVSSGIGKVYEPTHIKRMAKAKVEEINLISEAVDKNVILPIKYENEGITVDTQNIQELMIRAQNRTLFQEMRKQQNIESIVEKAYTELEKEKEVSSEEVDQDWIIRFFNSIEDISEEDMKEIWAKILVGEIKQPKSVSKRSLEVLRNLSKEEAEIFKKVCSCCVKLSTTIGLVSYDNELAQYNINFNEILLLSEIGLIKTEDNLNMTYSLVKNQNSLIAENNNLGMIAYIKEHEDQMNIPIYALTKTGQEFANIFGIIANDLKFKQIAELIKEKNKKENITMGCFSKRSLFKK